ncbi:MAG: hypothetical protein WD770_04545 [Actinomycetota bacterium]
MTIARPGSWQSLIAPLLIAAALVACGPESGGTDMVLPSSSAVTSLQDVYGVGCPTGWEYRRYFSSGLGVEFRDPASSVPVDPPIVAEFIPFPTGFASENGDAKVLAEFLVARGDYRIQNIAETEWNGRSVTVVDLIDPTNGRVARHLFYRGMSYGGEWLTILLTGKKSVESKFEEALGGFRPLKTSVELDATLRTQPWKPCP